VQNAGDAALAAAVNSADRYLVYKLEADWGRNGLYNHALSNLTEVVQSIQIDRDITGSLPDETTMVEGYYAAKMTVTLGGRRPGDTVPLARALSPWNTGGSLFGDGKLTIRIRAYIGHRVASGAVTTPQQFQGVITDFSVDSRTGRVSLTCVDNADLLRVPIDLPLFALEDSGGGKPVYDWRLNSQWVIDYVLRRNGIYMTPPPHAKAIWSCTNHGAPIPEIGWMAYHFSYASRGQPQRNPQDKVAYLARAGWGLAVGGDDRASGPVIYSRGRTGPTGKPGDSLTAQAQIDTSKIASQYVGTSGNFLVYGTGANTDGGAPSNGVGNIQVLFGIDATGHQKVTFKNWNQTTVATAVSGSTVGSSGYTDVWYRVNCGSPMSASTVVFSHGGSVAVDLSLITQTNGDWPFPAVGFAPIWPMTDVQLVDSTGVTAPADRYDPTTWVPQADIDTGLLNMTGLPLRRGVDSWELIKEIAGAEYGVAGFDETGRFFFKNRNTLRRQGLTVEATLTNDRMITDMALGERTGSVRNTVTAKVSPRLITPHSLVNTVTTDPWEVVWTLKDPQTMVAEAGSNAFQIQLDDPAWVPDCIAGFGIIQDTAGPSFNPQINAADGRFMAVRQGTPSVPQTGVLISMTVLPPEYGYDQVLLQVFNPGIYPILFATTEGTPAFVLIGRKYRDIKATPLRVTRASSAAKYGPRVLDLPDSDWRQYEPAVGDVMRSLLKDLKAPVPTVSNLTAVGDCRLQNQDTVVVEDTAVLGGPMYTTVTGISRKLSPEGQGWKLADTLNVRPFAAPGKWILGHPTWGVLGQTTKL
jgi:hypothetical protein